MYIYGCDRKADASGELLGAGTCLNVGVQCSQEVCIQELNALHHSIANSLHASTCQQIYKSAKG
jgi:hypothetical protein